MKVREEAGCLLFDDLLAWRVPADTSLHCVCTSTCTLDSGPSTLRGGPGYGWEGRTEQQQLEGSWKAEEG